MTEILLTDNQIKILKKINKGKYKWSDAEEIDDEFQQLFNYRYIRYWSEKIDITQDGKLILDVNKRNKKQNYRQWLQTAVAISALIVSIIALIIAI